VVTDAMNQQDAKTEMAELDAIAARRREHSSHAEGVALESRFNGTPAGTVSRADGMSPVSARLAGLSPEKQAMLAMRLKARRKVNGQALAVQSGLQRIPRRPDSRTAPLSYSQELMWLLNQVLPNSYVYGVPRSMRLTGHLDIEALRRALDTIVERHEILRTTYHLVDGAPTQTIEEHRPFQLPVIDLSGLPSEERERLVETYFVKDFEKGFDFARDLLLRGNLLKLGEHEHVLILSTHHIASDGHSKQVLFRELAALYGACRAGQDSPLAELPIQYADFAYWQRQQLGDEAVAALLGYWREKLAGAPALMNLPADRPRPPVQSYRGGIHRRILPVSLLQRLKTLAHREKTTLFITTLAAFKVLLHRYTGQEDLLIGTPVAGRDRTEFEAMLGYFTNTLVLRTDLSGDPTFRELLVRVRETFLDAHDHQELPFEKLVAELVTVRNQSHTPVFQVLFSLGHYAATAPQIPGLKVSQIFVDRGIAKFDLSAGLTESPDGLVVGMEYSEIFRRETIDRMIDQYQVLLEGITANPGQRLSMLPILPEDERRKILFEWNNTRRELPYGASIPRCFEAQVERSPEAVALIAGDQAVTYRELNARANQLAHALSRRGVGPEVPVGICIGRTPELAIAILGILKAGGACVPLDHSYPPERLAQMVSDSRTTALLTLQHFRPLLPELSASVICLDSDAKTLADELDENLTREPSPEQAAYIIYTSGSTGLPKGVVLTHRGLINHALAAIGLYGLTPSDRVLQFASLSFDISLEEIFPTWCAGATVVLRPDDGSFRNLTFARWLERERISVVDLPTAFWHQWVDELAGADETPPTTLRMVIVGGEKATAHARSTWARQVGRAVRWVNTYGPTEASVIATAYEPSRDLETPDDEADPPIGRPIDNTQVYILDQHRQPVPIGIPGEIFIGGDGLARGYLNAPELTAKRFIPNLFSADPEARLYRTGDRARWRHDGLIEFLGRADDQVKIRGYRIEPGEIEAVLLKQPDIKQAVVGVRDDAPGVKRLIAYVVYQTEPGPSPATLREQLSRTLPEYMIPATFVNLERLPLTPNGKVDRGALPAPDVASFSTGSAFVAPRTTAQKRLAKIWSEILGLDKVGIDDDFFELGGHSLLFLRLWAQINDEFGQDHPVNVLFRHRTVEQLAAFLEPGETVRTQMPDPAALDQSQKPRLFCLDYIALTVKDMEDVPIEPIGFFMCGYRPLWGIETVEELAQVYIKQLKESQPEGPYRLCGYCGSASIAYEMARQLEEQGDEIPMLVLIEPKGVGISRRPRRMVVRLRWIVFRLGHHVSWLVANPRRQWPEHIRRLLFSFFRKTPILKKLDTRALENPWWRERGWLKKAFVTYRPGLFRGRVHILLASQRVRISGDADIGWGSVALGGVDTHILPGEHNSIIRGRNTKILAEKVREIYYSSLP
jgi:amino acid adenylation domain-containing protein